MKIFNYQRVSPKIYNRLLSYLKIHRFFYAVNFIKKLLRFVIAIIDIQIRYWSNNFHSVYRIFF